MTSQTFKYGIHIELHKRICFVVADVCNRKILMFQTQHIYGPGAAWLCFILYMMSQNDVIKHQSDTSVYCRCYKLQYMYARRWMQ